MGKRIPFNQIVNFRDLGDYPVVGGHAYTVNGKIFRSGMMDGPIREDLDRLQELGVATIIDLRTPREIEKEPNPYRDAVNYYHINMSGQENAGRSFELAGKYDTPYFMAYRYIEYLENTDQVNEFFKVILNHSDKPLVYHCSAGKDRTGVMSYLILSASGVSLDDIVADYQVSFTYIKDHPKIIDENKGLNIYHSYPEVMELFHRLFTEKYGTVDNYFHLIGLTSEQVEKIKQLLVMN